MSSFPVITDTQSSHKIAWYRCPIEKDRLRDLTRRSDVLGLFQSLGHLILVGATGTAAYLLFSRGMWIQFAVILWVHGLFYSFIPGLATHELSHGTVFRTKVLNSVFFKLYCLIGWTNPYYYRASHTYHHMYTLHRDGDGEAVLPGNPSLRALRLLALFTVDVSTFVKIVHGTISLALTGKFAGIYKKDWSEAIFTGKNEGMKKKAILWARLMLLFHAVILAVSMVFRLWALPLIVTLGPFIANWWRYFIAATMHIGLRDNVPDWRKCARTISLDPVSRFLYWNMNFHIEHHMFAAVPCYRLKGLSRELAWDMPEKRTLLQAWKEMRYVYKRQRSEPSFQFDTSVPAQHGEKA